MDTHIFDRVLEGDRYLPADLLWEELHDHQRKELLHHLQHGNLVAEGRLIQSGIAPPYTDTIEAFAEIPRHIWLEQRSGGWEETEKMWVELSDASIGYADISLLNSQFLKTWLGYSASNPAVPVTEATLNVAAKKMSRNVWAAMAALVAKREGNVANAEVARILLERDDLWPTGAMDFDNLRTYVSDFMREFRSQF